MVKKIETRTYGDIIKLKITIYSTGIRLQEGIYDQEIGIDIRFEMREPKESDDNLLRKNEGRE